MKKTKKLIVPIALLVLAVMAVTSTTFAWFTTNATVKGSTIGAKITESEEMLWMVGIADATDSTNSNKWVTSITENLGSISGYTGIKMEDLTYLRAGDTNLKAGDNSTFIGTYNYVAQSGGDYVSDGSGGYVLASSSGTGTHVRESVGVVADGLYTKGGGTTTANGQFIEFTYNFWNSKTNVDLKVDLASSNLSCTTPSVRRFVTSEYNYFASLFSSGALISDSADVDTEDVVAFFATNTCTVPDNGYATKAAYEAAGYVVFNDGTSDWYFKAGVNGSYGVSAQNAARVMFTTTSNTKGPTRTIWNPGYGEGYDAETFDVQDLYRLVQSSALGVLPAASYDPYGDYGIDMTDGATPTATTVIDYETSTDASLPLTQFGSTTATKDGTVYYNAQVKITVWLEGWDSDCFNVILASDILTSFQFSV